MKFSISDNRGNEKIFVEDWEDFSQHWFGEYK